MDSALQETREKTVDSAIPVSNGKTTVEASRSTHITREDDCGFSASRNEGEDCGFSNPCKQREDDC